MSRPLRIGWIGTGVMGASMAGHLQAAGHELNLFTRSRDKAAPLLEAGAHWHYSPAEVAASSEVVCTMVGFPSDVREVILGDEGVLAGTGGGILLIDFTTSSPSLAVEIEASAKEKNVASLDAPVSGGDIGARNAALSIMCGGSQEVFDRAKPLLDLMGNTVVLQGPAGSGQHTKMVNQTIIASSMVAICEALLYARRSGLDSETVLQSVGGGAASSWALNNLWPRIFVDDYAPGFFVEHFVKDMDIALQECARMQINLPGLKLARELYGKLVEMGHDRDGTQALILALDAMPAIEPQ